jgi:hypothetical protein
MNAPIDEQVMMQSTRLKGAPMKLRHYAYVATIFNELNTSKSLPNIGMQWKKIGDTYYNTLLQNKTWQFMKLPIGRRAIG